MYSQGGTIEFRTIDRWDDGVGWMVHADEDGQRASYAIRGENGGV